MAHRIGMGVLGLLVAGFVYAILSTIASMLQSVDKAARNEFDWNDLRPEDLDHPDSKP